MSLLGDAEETPVTTILCVGAIAAFAAELSGRTVNHLVLYPFLLLHEPWRLVTSIFPHGGFIHILFNLYWAWMLGRAIETKTGPRWMLLFALTAAVGSCAAQIATGAPGIGLSGVNYGLAFYLYSRGKHDPKFFGIVDERLRNFFLAWFVICIVLTYAGAYPVANMAHGAGGLIGYLWGKRKRPWIGPATAAAAVAVAVGLALAFPKIRWTGDPKVDQRVSASRSIPELEALVEEHPKLGVAWWNLSILYDKAGRGADADHAQARATKLDRALRLKRE